MTLAEQAPRAMDVQTIDVACRRRRKANRPKQSNTPARDSEIVPSSPSDKTSHVELTIITTGITSGRRCIGDSLCHEALET
jgi:hypothetical protein